MNWTRVSWWNFGWHINTQNGWWGSIWGTLKSVENVLVEFLDQMLNLIMKNQFLSTFCLKTPFFEKTWFRFFTTSTSNFWRPLDRSISKFSCSCHLYHPTEKKIFPKPMKKYPERFILEKTSHFSIEKFVWMNYDLFPYWIHIFIEIIIVLWKKYY